MGQFVPLIQFLIAIRLILEVNMSNHLYRKDQYSEGSLKLYAEHDKETLNKMYPSVNISDKYILFLDLRLFWNYEYTNIEVDIAPFIEDYLTFNVPKYRIRQPFPNKRIHTPTMVNGKKVSNLGIPLIFNSFEELNNIREIQIRWHITMEKTDYYVFDRIKLVVQKPQNDRERIYGIYSYIIPSHFLTYVYPEESDLQRKLEQYSLLLAWKHKDELNVHTGKCEIFKNGESEEGAIATIDFDDGFSTFVPYKKNRNFDIDYFRSDITLEAGECSYMINHFNYH